MRIFYHLPGLFEFYDLYKAFLPLYRKHRKYFYDWCEIGSIYGAPKDCLWGGGRVGFGDAEPESVAALTQEYGISARLTFSNSLIREEHLVDKKCNELCKLFENGAGQNGIIIHSDLLLDYIKANYPGYYFVSSTTKVITDFEQFRAELERNEFSNECCWFGCYDRKACYENVSRKSLGEDCADHICVSPTAKKGYRFSDAMKNPGFIGIDDILGVYAPAGFRHFKIEGRSLGSAIVLEFLLYYMTKPEHQLKVREEIYLDSSLDLF